MPNNQNIFLHLNLFENQYPGIANLSEHFQSLPILISREQIKKLTNLIRFNVPKAHYTQDLLEIDEKIQEEYYRALDRDRREQEVPLEMERRVSPVSDEQGAEAIRQQEEGRRDTNQVEKRNFSVSEVKNFVEGFLTNSNDEMVSQDIKKTLQQFVNAKRQKTTLDSFDQKPEKRIEKKASTYSSHSNNQKNYSAKNKQVSPKNQMIIIVGDKIPLEVKQMRSYVKQNSQNNFLTRSEQQQLSKTDLQKAKVEISLTLNKVAIENANDLFQEIKSLVIFNEQLASFYVEQTIQKCLTEFKMISVYIHFFCLFSKIQKNQLKWGSQQGKTNSIHNKFIDRLQQVFAHHVQNPQSLKALKALGFMIGTLIFKKKLSRKIYEKVSNVLISAIISSKNIENNQSFFQCHLQIIESLKTTFEEIEQQNRIEQVLSQKNKQSLKTLFSGVRFTNIKEILQNLEKNSKFPTARIRCLIENLFERMNCHQSPSEKIAQVQTHQQQNEKVKQAKHFLKQQNGVKLALQLYNKTKSEQVLSEILLHCFTGLKSQVQQKTQSFIEHFSFNNQQFFNFWQNKFAHLAYQQCDLPFMTASLAIIFTQFFKDQAEQCIIMIREDDPDFEDLDFFMQKLQKKIKFYKKNEDRTIFH